MDEAAAEVMRHLDEEYQATWARIAAANEDLRERVLSHGMLLCYEPDEDTLSLRLNIAEPAMAETRDDLIWTYVHPQTFKLLGVEITGLQDFLAAHPEGRPSAERLLAIAMQAPGEFVPAPVVENAADLLLFAGAAAA